MFKFDLQQFGGTPPRVARADSQAVLQAALSTIPADAAENDDDEVLAPTGAGGGSDQHEPEYLDENEQPIAAAPVPAGGAQPLAPAPAAAAPARPAGAQPAAAPPAAAAPAPGTAVITPPVGAAADPWAETEDVTYEDTDTGQSYIVRAPKSYAEQVKNGYTRRSMLNRNTNWLARHRATIEPLIADNQFEALVPFIERGRTDREFAEYVNQAYQRRVNGLPLNVTPPAGTPPAAVTAPGVAPAGGGVDINAMYAELDKRDDIDAYTKESVKALVAPFMGIVGTLQQQIETDRQTRAETERVASENRQRQQTNYESERQLGFQMRRALQTYFPGEFNERTPVEQYTRVLEYAQQSNLFKDYGRTPGTIVLAYQQLQSPTGGISPAGATVAEIRARAEHIASAAAGGVAAAVAPGGPSGAAAAPAPRVDKVPRFVKNRDGSKRPLTPREVSKYLETHPNATI